MYISQKSCFTLKTKKHPLTCRCNFYSQCSEKMCIIRQPVKCFTKNVTVCEFFTNFSQIFPQIVKFFVKNFVKFNVKIHVLVYFTIASQFLRSRRCGIIFIQFLTRTQSQYWHVIFERSEKKGETQSSNNYSERLTGRKPVRS